MVLKASLAHRSKKEIYTGARKNNAVMSHIVHSGGVGYSFVKIEQSNFGEPVLMMNILQKSESLQQTILLQNQGRFKFYFISNIDKLILGRS